MTTSEFITTGSAIVFGGLLCAVVLAFTFSQRFRRDVMRASRGNIQDNQMTGQVGEFKVTAQGAVTALVALFVLALAALASLPYVSKAQVPSDAQVQESEADAKKVREELSRAISQSDRAAAKLREVKVKAFYIGQYDRSPFGQRFPCGYDAGKAAKSVCGVGLPISIEAIAGHGGNQCGYSYFAVACAPKD